MFLVSVRGLFSLLTSVFALFNVIFLFNFMYGSGYKDSAEVATALLYCWRSQTLNFWNICPVLKKKKFFILLRVNYVLLLFYVTDCLYSCHLWSLIKMTFKKLVNISRISSVFLFFLRVFSIVWCTCHTSLLHVLLSRLLVWSHSHLLCVSVSTAVSC